MGALFAELEVVATTKETWCQSQSNHRFTCLDQANEDIHSILADPNHQASTPIRKKENLCHATAC
jgi:hypothetical protein